MARDHSSIIAYALNLLLAGRLEFKFNTMQNFFMITVLWCQHGLMKMVIRKCSGRQGHTPGQ